MNAQQIDLGGLFGQVVGALAQHKQELNQADDYNQNHGDNMVEIFSVITQAMEEKRNAPASDQLAYASQLLRQKESGSAQAYAQGLSQASQKFQGQPVTSNNAFELIQTLIGAGEQAPPPTAPENPLAGFLGGLLGGGAQAQAEQPDSGLDAGDLVNAGLAFLQAKQQGDSDTEALLNAVVATSGMGASAHRQQSTSLVASTLLQALGSMTSK